MWARAAIAAAAARLVASEAQRRVGRRTRPGGRGARRARREDRQAVGGSPARRNRRGDRAQLVVAPEGNRGPARADQGDPRPFRPAVACARADPAHRGGRRCRAAAFGGRGADPAAEGDGQPRDRPTRAARPWALGRGAVEARRRAGRHGRALRFRRAGERAHRRGTAAPPRPGRQASGRQEPRRRREGPSGCVPGCNGGRGRRGSPRSPRAPRPARPRAHDEARPEDLLEAVRARARVRRDVPRRRVLVPRCARRRPVAARGRVSRRA